MARWRKYFSQLLNVNVVKDVGQAEIQTAGPLVPEPSAAEFELAVDKLKSHKLLGIEKIPAEMFNAGSRKTCLGSHKHITSIWKKEKLPEEWKKSNRVPTHRKEDKTDCNNYRGISTLPTTYKILSNILLSRLIRNSKEITGDHKCGFRRKMSTIDHIFRIRQILEKKMECNDEVNRLFIDFKKAYDLVSREI